MRVETILTPADIATLPQRNLSESVCVVFDVLRATSTILTAFANGARRIFPAATIEEARQRQREFTPGALLGGERGGVRIEGFDLGNSPREYTRDVVADRDIITTTTNGTVALRACAGACETVVGAFLNLEALAHFLSEESKGSHLVLVCAGTGSCFALEDGLAAGALLSHCKTLGEQPFDCDDASLAMLAMHQHAGLDPLPTLRASENGRKLAEIGLGLDVDWCARTSVIPCVAIMGDEGLEARLVPANG